MRSSALAGKIGEDYAVTLLRRKGYKILTRNFRSKFGEIDIVAQERDMLVFVEVKTRWSPKFGNPEEAVTTRKLAHLTRAAHYFKLLNPKTPDASRIDVVATEVRGGKVTTARILKNVTGF